MEIKFEFNEDKSQVKLSASVGHPRQKPPPELRKTVSQEEVVAEFMKLHPDVEIESISGWPRRLFNCKGPELSVGNWLLNLKVAKKVPDPKIKKTRKSVAPKLMKKGD